MSNLPNIDFSTILSANGANFSSNDITPTPYELHNIRCEYWETPTLGNWLSNTNNQLLFLHLNIQCLPAKYDSLITFLKTLSDGKEQCLPAIIAVTETWLKPQIILRSTSMAIIRLFPTTDLTILAAAELVFTFKINLSTRNALI